MGTQLATINRNLPADLSLQVQRIGYRLLSTFDRLGLYHQNADGTCFTLSFSDAILFGDEVVVFVVDTERLPMPIARYSKPEIVQHLSAVVHLPVKALTHKGLRFLVRLKPVPVPSKLPGRAELDLENRPADPLAVPVGDAARKG